MNFNTVIPKAHGLGSNHLVVVTDVSKPPETGAAKHAHSLTPREEEVLGAMALGMTNPAIAEHFGISISAVENHINSIYSKLGLGGPNVHARVMAVLVYQRDMYAHPELARAVILLRQSTAYLRHARTQLHAAQKELEAAVRDYAPCGLCPLGNLDQAQKELEAAARDYSNAVAEFTAFINSGEAICPSK